MREGESRLAKARNDKGLSQMQVAQRAHISLNSYQRYEVGLREPRAKAANRIAEILDSDPRELFGT